MQIIEKNFLFIYFLQIMIAIGGLINIIGCSKNLQEPLELRSRIVETGDYIEVTGLGAGSVDENISEAEAKRSAAEIANFQAIGILSEVVQGIAIRGEMTLRDLRLSEGELTQIVNTRLDGVKTDSAPRYEQQEDGSWLAAATIRWDKINASTLAAEIRNSEIVKNKIAEKDGSRNYSGIILDLRYIYGYNALLTPKIVTEDGKLLISTMNIETDYLVSNYGISIFSTINEAVLSGNVGDYPLKLVPKEYDAETGSVILSPTDIQKLSDSLNKDTLVRLGKIAVIL